MSLNLALMALANPLTLTGMTALGVLLKLMAVSLGVLMVILGIIMSPLRQVLSSMERLANMDMSGLGNTFASIAESMMKMSVVKLVVATRMIKQSESALRAAKAAGFGVGVSPVTPAPGGGGGGGTQRARTQQVPRITIPITLELDGDKFAETVVDVVDQAGYEAATGRG